MADCIAILAILILKLKLLNGIGKRMTQMPCVLFAVLMMYLRIKCKSLFV